MKTKNKTDMIVLLINFKMYTPRHK